MSAKPSGNHTPLPEEPPPSEKPDPSPESLQTIAETKELIRRSKRLTDQLKAIKVEPRRK
jgi:hypothetical protein